MNSELVKLKVKSDIGVDIHIQHEIIRLKGRMNNLEALFNTRFNNIENSSNEFLKTVLKSY